MLQQSGQLHPQTSRRGEDNHRFRKLPSYGYRFTAAGIVILMLAGMFAVA